MKSVDCVVSRCSYLEKINHGSGMYRCLHPDAGKGKRTWKRTPGRQLKALKKCPKPSEF